MCIRPSFIWVRAGVRWVKQPVACRQCWRCRKNRARDYIGRALCEASTSRDVCVVTLTYAPRSDLADQIIEPKHFQRFVRALRRRGHSVRYLAVGEYGALKGRAHFHALLFFPVGVQGGAGFVPGGPLRRDCPQGERVFVEEWPHGHVFVDWRSDVRAVRYVCKYLLKGDGSDRVWVTMSKKPPLGAAFFEARAAEYARLGVLPRSFEYRPPGDAMNAPPYLMTGATRRDFIDRVCRDPSVRGRMSEWIGRTFDARERARWIAAVERAPLDVVVDAIIARQAEARRDAAEDRAAEVLRLGEALLTYGGVARIVAGRIVYRGQDYGAARLQGDAFARYGEA